ncbi:MAG: efflux RND transporter periplasmic adaptor subunit [Planctomycetes bacterium]|nr:efflux RND transporter periplasmic adaptor subunit [Planctomycetota bacterium]
MKKLLLVVLVLAAGAIALGWWRLSPKPHPVKVVRVKRGMVEATATATSAGTVAAAQQAKLRPEGTGRVARIVHPEGDIVATGDPILELDSDVLRARLASALESVHVQDAAKTTAVTWEVYTETEFRRIEKMWKPARQEDTPMVSEQQYQEAHWRWDDARAKSASTVALLVESKARVAEIQVEIDKMTLRAPFDGRITEMNVEIGETVAPTTELCEVQTSLRLEIEAPFDETDFGKIRVGMEARLSFDAFPDEPVKGVVSKIAPKVTATKEKNRTVLVTVAIPAAGKLSPGLSADVVIVTRQVPGATFVPTRCLRDGKYVYVVEGGKARRLEIKTGVSNWETTEVLEIAEGTPVISLLDLDFTGELDGKEVTVMSEE